MKCLVRCQDLIQKCITNFLLNTNLMAKIVTKKFNHIYVSLIFTKEELKLVQQTHIVFAEPHSAKLPLREMREVGQNWYTHERLLNSFLKRTAIRAIVCC